ncbi:MAG: hypothetical protein ACXWR0_05035 [Bdellovibrio sp.]
MKIFKNTKFQVVSLIFVIFLSFNASASIFGEEDAILLQILDQAIQQYAELQSILKNGGDTLGLLQEINRGINDSLFLIKTIKPNIDPGIYKDLQNTSDVLAKIGLIYGHVAPSPDQHLQQDTDQQVAEAIALNNSIYDYTRNIDQIGEDIKNYSHSVSPGGAQKLTAQSLGVLLHVMNESLRAQATSLKLQAVNLSIQNKKDKEFTKNTMAITDSLKSSMQTQQSQFSIPRF